MAMTFENFIVLDARTSLKNIRETRDEYKWTDTGSRIYNVGKPVPIIQSGECVGIATIKSFTVTETSTTVIFTVDQLSDKATLKAYYNLYRMNASMNRNADDAYSSDDIIIPGMVSGNQTIKSSRYRDDDDDDDSLSAALNRLNKRR